jgi:hypothetical protein
MLLNGQYPYEVQISLFLAGFLSLRFVLCVWLCAVLMADMGGEKLIRNFFFELFAINQSNFNYIIRFLNCLRNCDEIAMEHRTFSPLLRSIWETGRKKDTWKVEGAA